MMERRNQDLHTDSWLVSAGRSSAPGAPLNVPLQPASNFILGAEKAYSRDDGTLTWEALEAVLGGLECGDSVAFSSGMAAIAAVIGQLPVGAVIALPDDCYQGVAGLVAEGAAQGRWTVERIGVQDTPAWIRACRTADLLWLESPSNPLLVVADLDQICAAPRKEGLVIAVDNTLATPINQQPLELGATVSIQSVTKFIGGHSDLLAGVATTRDARMLHALRQHRELHGATPGTLEAFLATRGVRTLALRLQRAQATALDLATWLASHPAVTRVRYPGLPTHESHEAARRLLKGFGSVISFEIRGGAAAADQVCDKVRLIRHATNLGAVESTMERRRATPLHRPAPPRI